MTDTRPWVEKYRPTHFDDIVLDPLNKKLLENIIGTITRGKDCEIL